MCRSVLFQLSHNLLEGRCTLMLSSSHFSFGTARTSPLSLGCSFWYVFTSTSSSKWNLVQPQNFHSIQIDSLLFLGLFFLFSFFRALHTCGGFTCETCHPVILKRKCSRKDDTESVDLLPGMSPCSLWVCVDALQVFLLPHLCLQSTGKGSSSPLGRGRGVLVVTHRA